MADYERLQADAATALAAGDARAAFQQLREVLRYPGQLGADRRRWTEALALFERISAALAGAAFAAKVVQVVADPDDVSALYALGDALVEQRLPAIAATILARANTLAPGRESIVTELMTALEMDLLNAEACRFLRAAPDLLARSFHCRYLLAFNAIMTGDLAEPRRLLPGLRMYHGEPYQGMTTALEGMLARADALDGVAALDGRDLRGWHFVLNGSILLHLSPFGFDEGMHGRYAYIQDSDELCLEGIRRLAVALDALGLSPPRVFALPDRESAILAEAVAHLLELPVEPWVTGRDGVGGTVAPGLVVAYDLDRLPPEVLRSLTLQRPGQVLFSHATCWLSEPMFAADLTTYLYQVSRTPWETRLAVDPETRQVKESAPREGEVAELATRLVGTTLPAEALPKVDLAALRALAARAGTMTGDATAGALRSEGDRRRLRLGSPVPSNRFL